MEIFHETFPDLCDYQSSLVCPSLCYPLLSSALLSFRLSFFLQNGGFTVFVVLFSSHMFCLFHGISIITNT